MADFPIIAFSSQKEYEIWLDANHESADGIWMKIYKKNSGIPTISYAQAVETSLCYGWIDSQLKSLDEKAYIQKFTPRRSKSIWSKINREHIARLIKEGRMKPAGLKQVEEAQKDGRWADAYDSPSTTTIPEDFLRELKKNKIAHDFFLTLTKSNVYAITWRLQTAKKPETRLRRMHTILEMLARKEKIH